MIHAEHDSIFALEPSKNLALPRPLCAGSSGVEQVVPNAAQVAEGVRFGTNQGSTGGQCCLHFIPEAVFPKLIDLSDPSLVRDLRRDTCGDRTNSRPALSRGMRKNRVPAVPARELRPPRPQALGVAAARFWRRTTGTRALLSLEAPRNEAILVRLRNPLPRGTDGHSCIQFRILPRCGLLRCSN